MVLLSFSGTNRLDGPGSALLPPGSAAARAFLESGQAAALLDSGPGA